MGKNASDRAGDFQHWYGPVMSLRGAVDAAAQALMRCAAGIRRP